MVICYNCCDYKYVYLMNDNKLNDVVFDLD